MVIVIEMHIQDEITPKLQRIIRRLPMHVMVIKQHATNIITDELKNTLNQMRGKKGSQGFKSVNRLLRGITVESKSANESNIYIQASGAIGTIGSEKVVGVLNRGTIRPHPIFPRRVSGYKTTTAFMPRGARAGPKGRPPYVLTLKKDRSESGAVPNIDPRDSAGWPYVVFARFVLRHKVAGRFFFQKAVKSATPKVKRQTGHLLRTLIKLT